MGLAEFRQARSAEKRAAMLAAAITVFRREGYGGAAMEAIAKRAQVSTATLYRHFASKAALFEAVAADAIDALTADAPDPALPAIERLRRLARTYAETLARPETRAIVRMLVAETGRNDELAERFYAAVKSKLGDVFDGAVAQAAAEGAARPEAASAGQLQGMIEHATLMRGLILGDEAPPAADPLTVADEAVDTWLAHWGA